jgi:hypothetical protein
MKRRPAWLLAVTVMVVAGSPVVLSVEQWTGLDGDYNLPAAPGTYSVTASALGHQSAFQQVTVQADVTVTVDLALTPWAATVYQPLIVRNAGAQR